MFIKIRNCEDGIINFRLKTIKEVYRIDTEMQKERELSTDKTDDTVIKDCIRFRSVFLVHLWTIILTRILAVSKI